MSEHKSKRSRFLGRLGRFAARRRWWIILGALVLTGAAGYLANELTFRTHMTDVLPADDPQVDAFQEILDAFDSANFISVVVQGEDRELMKSFAAELAPRLEELDEYVHWVNYRSDNDFVSNHGLMLLKEADLVRLRSFFEGPGLADHLTALNDSLESSYIGESVQGRERENEAVQRIDGMFRFAGLTAGHLTGRDESDSATVARRAVHDMFIGEPYIFSPNYDYMLMWIQPNFGIDDIDMLQDGVNGIEAVVEKTAARESYEGKLDVGLAGALALQRDEMEAGIGDMKFSSLIALALVLLTLIFFFRMLVAPLMTAVPLIFAITWTAGAIYLYSGNLNMMSMFFSLFIIGLGIDYAIHIIAGVNEARADGLNVEDALAEGLQRSGSGIITGALTTAAAFFALLAGKMQGVQDMGFVSGVAIIFALLAMMLVLPALLAVREKFREKRGKTSRLGGSAVEFSILGRLGRAIDRRPWLFAVVGLAVGGFLLFSAITWSEFDWNFYNMEPKGLESIELAKRIEEEFDLSPDYSLFIAESVDECREVHDKLKDKGYIGEVDTVSRFIPTDEEYARRAPLLEEFRGMVAAWEAPPPPDEAAILRLADELERLEMNILELRTMAELGALSQLQTRCEQYTAYGSDEESPLAALAAELRVDPAAAARRLAVLDDYYFAEQRAWLLGDGGRGFTNPERVELDDLTEDMLTRYRGRHDDEFLVTIFPRFDLWKSRDNLDTFVEGVAQTVPSAVGVGSLFHSMMGQFGDDGVLATLIALGIIVLLLLIDFRKLHTVILALVPLAFGGVILFGTMALLGIKLNFMNYFSLPLILGIGIDDGVHIIHRYRRERSLTAAGAELAAAKPLERTLSRTGRAVMLTSITTGIGFASMIFAKMQGLASMGLSLTLGVIACFLTSVLLLPALIKVFERLGLRI